MSKVKIVISHNVKERRLAAAWKKLIEDVSLRAVEVWYSSDDDPTGGMTLGEEWRSDLYKRLAECDFVLAIQTPQSAGKPWIMWECGVASGVGRERGIIPILYNMERSILPTPLNVYQSFRGDKENQIREVCEKLILKADLSPSETLLRRSIRSYLEAIKQYLPDKPVRPEDITLWKERINELITSGRVSELSDMRDRMYLSLGKSPLDVALHDLLGRYLLQQGLYKEAIDETDYALTFSLKDIHLLHRKALALAGNLDLGEARKIVESIIAQDKIMAVDPEIASLQGRIYRDQWLISQNHADLEAALEAYQRVYKAKPNSYYAGGNVVELAFAIGNDALGTEVANEVLEICKKEQRQQNVSYWVDFTAGLVHIALNEIDQAVKEYQKGMMRKEPPDPFARQSATKGINRIASIKKLAQDDIERVKAVLQ